MSTQNPNTPTTMHPTMGMTWKRALKIERIARLTLDPMNYSVQQIANHMGCHYQTVVYIKQLPEFHAKMMELQSGVTSQYDQHLRENIDNARSELKSMIPSSMMVIRNSLLSKNENIRMKAAFEVLDREGSMAKVSKTSVTHEVKPSLDIDPTVESNLMQLLKAAPVGSVQADILSASFTMNAADAKVQEVEMTEANSEATLEQLDLSTQKPN